MKKNSGGLLITFWKTQMHFYHSEYFRVWEVGFSHLQHPHNIWQWQHKPEFICEWSSFLMLTFHDKLSYPGNSDAIKDKYPHRAYLLLPPYFHYSLVHFQIIWNTISLTKFSGPSASELSTHRCSLCSPLSMMDPPHCRLSAEVQLLSHFERNFRKHFSSSVEFSIWVLLFICIVTTHQKPATCKGPTLKVLMKLGCSHYKFPGGLWQSRTQNFLILITSS